MSEGILVELPDVVPKTSIADEIWGPANSEEVMQRRVERLESFFECYRKEPEFDFLHYNDVFAAIRALKNYPEIRKADVRCEVDLSRTTDDVAEAVVLDLAVRSMFLTACTRRAEPGAEALGRETIFRPYWKESESLARYLGRVFPISQPPQQDLLGFKANKLKASYLQAYAGIRIEWTNYLSDHLILLRGETWKKLYIFRHPGFIKVSLERLAMMEGESTPTSVEAIKL
jgi:hypothetical protein